MAQSFGERLAQLRRERALHEARDIDHRDVAAAVGASPASVSRWEAGQVYPGDAYLQRLAEYFGVTRAWLRYGEGDREPAKRRVPVPDPRKERPATTAVAANSRRRPR